MLKYGFVGFGQVGGLFANDAKGCGERALAFNTAQVDLKGLEALDETECIHLVGYEGAGKDRGIGEEAFFNHQEMIAERIKNKMNDCHVLFPIFAIGGGTGSGMCAYTSRMLTELFPTKVVCPILFLPDDVESLRSKMNALEAFSELSNIEEIGAIFMIDNQRVMSTYTALPLKEKYEQSRLECLRLLLHLNHVTDRNSSISNLDSMDLLTTFSEKGQAVVFQIQLLKKELEQPVLIGKRLLHQARYGIHAENELKQMTKASLVYELPSEWTSVLKSEALLGELATPLETFVGVYPQNEASLTTLFTGLAYSSPALHRFEMAIKENENHIIHSLDVARTQTYDAKQSWTNSLKRKRKIQI